LNYDNSTNAYLGFQVNKLYYVFGQFSRFIKSGAVRIQTTSTEPTLSVSAFKYNDALTIVVVNNTMSSLNGVTFNLVSLPGISSVQPVRTSNLESWAEGPPISVTASAFAADFPVRSVTTFTWNVPGAGAGGGGAGAAGGTGAMAGGGGAATGGVTAAGGVAATSGAGNGGNASGSGGANGQAGTSANASGGAGRASDKGGCGCRAAGGRTRSLGAFVLAAGLLFVRRSRKVRRGRDLRSARLT
jgi:hypothetical protein